MTEENQNPSYDEKLVAKLVEEHLGWASAIAKSVARSWNLDWQLDGLDGGAYEGLLFCAKRFDPTRGVPFKAYARRRIHESATEEARKSKSWQQGVGCGSEEEQTARDISFTLLKIFPEIREGLLPHSDEEDGDITRRSVQQLLTGASLIAAFQQSPRDNPELAIEFNQLISIARSLEPVHQAILYELYWKGQSMRGLAADWGIDELSIMREHKEILLYLFASLEAPSSQTTRAIKVRRSLRVIAQKMKKQNLNSPFESAFSAGIVIAFALIAQLLQNLEPLTRGTSPW